MLDRMLHEMKIALVLLDDCLGHTLQRDRIVGVDRNDGIAEAVVSSMRDEGREIG